MTTVATNLGLDSITGKYRVLVKSDKVKGECVVRDFDDKYEARKFVYNVNHEKLEKQPSQDCFELGSKSGFAPEQKPLPDYRPRPIVLLPKWIPVGCDMPEQGGISGNMNKNKSAFPFICS